MNYSNNYTTLKPVGFLVGIEGSISDKRWNFDQDKEKRFPGVDVNQILFWNWKLRFIRLHAVFKDGTEKTKPDWEAWYKNKTVFNISLP